MQEKGKHADLTYTIIGSAMEVHKSLGAGLLESAYEECLGEELKYRGVTFKRQVSCPLIYKGKSLENSLRIDFLVEGVVIVEIKSVASLNELHEAQLLTYMRLSGKTVGLIVNFNTKQLKDGIKRMVL